MINDARRATAQITLFMIAPPRKIGRKIRRNNGGKTAAPLPPRPRPLELDEDSERREPMPDFSILFSDILENYNIEYFFED